MKIPAFHLPVVVALTLGILGAGCAGPAPQQNPPRTGAARSARGPQVLICVLKHEATRQQREVAKANARRAYFSQSARRQAALRRGRRSRYIAVQTVRNTESSGEASCMVFDTKSQQLVGNTVYDCNQTPRIGAAGKFDSFDATYVGG